MGGVQTKHLTCFLPIGSTATVADLVQLHQQSVEGLGKIIWDLETGNLSITSKTNLGPSIEIAFHPPAFL